MKFLSGSSTPKHHRRSQQQQSALASLTTRSKGDNGDTNGKGTSKAIVGKKSSTATVAEQRQVHFVEGPSKPSSSSPRQAPPSPATRPIAAAATPPTPRATVYHATREDQTDRMQRLANDSKRDRETIEELRHSLLKTAAKCAQLEQENKAVRSERDLLKLETTIQVGKIKVSNDCLREDNEFLIEKCRLLHKKTIDLALQTASKELVIRKLQQELQNRTKMETQVRRAQGLSEKIILQKSNSFSMVERQKRPLK